MKGKTILIVDDDPNILNIVGRMIRMIHPETVIMRVPNGDHAWRIINVPGDHKPALVISDISMPQMGGVELTQKIRTEHPEIRVVLMSGDPEPREHKAHAFVPKPLSLEMLIGKIEEAMAKA
jgi:DNA-binding NtrC family response regulator